jgi:hypothetical protein
LVAILPVNLTRRAKRWFESTPQSARPNNGSVIDSPASP